MKRLLPFALFIVLLSSTIAQIPQGISYQAVIRDSNGNLVANSPIGISIQILQGSPGGAQAYQEWHFLNSNANGLVSFVIGQGQFPSTNFPDINWRNGPYFLNMGVDPTGGMNPGIFSTVQFFSVPYAFVAEHALGLTLKDSNGNIHEIQVDTSGNLFTQAIGAPCPGMPTVTDINGNVYNTVLIGNQCWMKENLKVTQNPSGGSIQRYCYNNIASNCDLYGGLYTWATMMNGAASSNSNPSGVQGICPNGWHLPSNAEWQELNDYVESINPTAIGNQLKSCRQDGSPLGGACDTGTHPRWDSDLNHYGTDYFGFSALPGGTRSTTGVFSGIGTNGSFWTTAQSSASDAFSRQLFNSSPDLFGGIFFAQNKNTGLSVRCIRDASQTTTIPTVVTDPITGITQNSATSGGDVIDDGNSPVTQRGVCWNTSPNPTTAHFTTNDGSGTGAFVSNLTGLTPNTTYYVRAYAINGVGTAYGNEEIFTTSAATWNCGDQISDIDANSYNTVLIGTQCWMKENLKTTQYRNGTPIEYPGTNNMAWENNTSGAYAWYDNQISNKDLYGALYNWYAAANMNGLCPTGWHVPSDAEWAQLLDYVVIQGFPNDWFIINAAGNALKSCRQVNSQLGGACNTTQHPRWDEDTYSGFNYYGFDEFDFSGLPGGSRHHSGQPFNEIGTHGKWWSSTEILNNVWYRMLSYSEGHLMSGNIGKNIGFSVRCVKD